MHLLVAFFLFAFTFTSVPAQTSHNSSYADQQALLAFKYSLSLDSYNSLHDWSPDHTFCNWTGIACSSHRQRVVSLILKGMGLVGPVSPSLGNLTFLRVLDLSNNSLQGGIPNQLGRLFRLRMLLLSKNELDGAIPSTIGGCQSLQLLSLAYNHLKGSIPIEIGLLLRLEKLWLGANQLSGNIPSSIGNMSSLTELQLAENMMGGHIPVELGMLTQIKLLDLYSNNFTGSIPTALSNCTRLQILEISDNHLIGHIPRELGTRLSKLEILYLWGNQLTGEIPTPIANCTQLQELALELNQLSGTVPMEFGKLLQLRRLFLFGNQLVSRSNTTLLILTALTNCSHLRELNLAENYLTGGLPSSIGQLSPGLFSLFMDENSVEGTIPVELGNLTNLAVIGLSNNHFNGTIPSTLNRLLKLERLYLNRNNLHGSIPQNLGLLKSLGRLSLFENKLSGQIPESLGSLPQLRDLLLYHNQLSGKIPASLGRCQTLENLDMSYNKLTGNIPPEVASLPNLQKYFNLSNNLLRGSLPSELSKMIMVQAIDVSLNCFSGGIPSALATCTALQYLNLSWNSFQGPIPASLTKLQNLQDIDLSSNNLSGTIPLALQGMKMLQHLNFSLNKLTGEVPQHGLFARLNASAVMGNPGLCGTWIHLKPCSFSKHKQPSLLKTVLVPVVIGTAVFVMCFVFVGFYKKRKSHSMDTLALNFGPKRISYEELVDATHGFAEANLIGTGSFGSVYRGIMNNGTNIAVKVLNLQDENAHQSFGRECNVLRRVRHRNVIKIITSCSNLDFNFKALVLPFMSNGNLESWLYPKRGDECNLNLSERLRIAIEIAEGMAYLHHHCFVQVVHCDLKPSNVLLGDDMTAYLADFSIAKLFFGNSMDSLTDTTVLKGSIGYIAPEYGMGGQIWIKGDVYSYGILLLELLTRKRPADDMFVEGMNLQKWASMDFPNRMTEVVDRNLLQDVDELERPKTLQWLTHLLQVGLICASELPQQRPSMLEIVKILNTIKGGFLGMPRAFKFPIDISSLIQSTSGAGRNLERHQ
ncbi:hypothetical protein KI387_043171, partial [Taxus chinensis]